MDEQDGATVTGDVSRRDFLRLPAAFALLTTATACAPRGRGGPLETLELARAEDQLALRFDFHNLRIEPRRHLADRLVRDDPDAEASLTVTFPAQHTAERANTASGETAPVAAPVKGRAAGPTRLVFRLPDGLDGIDLSVDALLDWAALEPGWNGNAATTALADASRIELPAGLVLDPSVGGPPRWLHASRPVAWQGRTELWQTRLGIDAGAGNPIRVLLPPETDPAFGELDTSLTAAQRSALAGREALAHTLILSPYGGWLDLRGRWDGDAELARWEHRATAGRDQFVLVEGPPGFLYPFGHRAAVVQVTERAANENGEGPALLQKQEFVVIKEPLVSYAAGEMPFRTLRAVTRTTPPIAGDRRDLAAFWIDTADAAPFAFRFEATDWAGNVQRLSAAAVFVLDEGIDAAEGLYADDARAAVDLDGQSVVVAPFDGAEREPPRSAGDTTLQLLVSRFAATRTPSDANGIPFRCGTDWLDARLPSLEPYLDAERNRGRFTLDNPQADGNVGEIFAVAAGDARIPLTFDRHADQVGGLITPAMRVEGVSRTQGPVGDAARIRSGEPVDPGSYFAPEARLLGVFPLGSDVFGDVDGRPDYVPQFLLSIVPDAPAAQDDEPNDDPDPEREDAAKAASGYTVELKLNWKFDMPSFDFLGVVTVESAAGKTAKIDVTAKTSRHFGGGSSGEQAEADAPATNPGDTARTDTEAGDGDSQSKVDWKVSATATDFVMLLGARDLGALSLGIEKLGVSLGPRKSGKKKEHDAEPDEPTDTGSGDDDDENAESAIRPEFEFRVGQVRGTGALAFINPLMARLQPPPKPPPLEFGERSSVYPATLPDASSADVFVNVGPIAVPDFRWMQFEVSNVSTNVGVGLYFFPREGRVPEPLFTLRVASADKPVTLTSMPWGGTSHLGLNITPSAITAIQFSVGVVYRATFDLGFTKALCSGGIAGVFTYVRREDEDDLVQADFVMKLQGAARIAGCIDLSLALTAVGTWQNEICYFYAELVVGVKVAFFSITVTVRFNHQFGSGPDTLMLGGAVCEPADYREAEWLSWRRAFAEAG